MLPAPNAGQSCRIWSSPNPKIGGGHEQPTLSSVVAEDGVTNTCRGGELVLGGRSKPSIAAAGSEGQIGISRVTFVTAVVTSKSCGPSSEAQSHITLMTIGRPSFDSCS
ncbi:hypothetical protein ACQJBY_073142 [Aegilops geniculata]